METTIKIRLSDETKKDFEEAVKKQGHTTSSMLRGVINSYIELDEKMEGKQFSLRVGAVEIVE